MNEQLTSPQLDILNDCLDAVIRREKTLAECLSQYPAEAAWLKAELQAALLVRSFAAPGMPEEAVKTLESRVLQQFNRRTPLSIARRRPALWFAGKWVAGFILVLAIAFGGGGTTVAASANSLPGDTLYGIKRAWENVIVFLATLVGSADDVWLHLAQVRFEEMQNLAAQGKLTPNVFDDVYATLERAIVLADEATTPRLVVFMMNAQSQLQLITPMPATETQYNRVTEILRPHFNSIGRLVLPDASTDTLLPVQPVAASATAEPTLTYTATVTPSLTPTHEPALTHEPTLAASSTPDVSATPTRTPTDTPTHTPTTTASPTPTYTWTPLPLPGGTLVTGTPFVIATTGSITSLSGVTPTGVQSFPIRPTQLAVYMTQTAIASGAVPTEEVTPP